MEKFSIVKKSGYKVACVREIPENSGGIAIAVHGYTSSKESPTVQLLLKRLPAAGIGVIGIDQPGHGEEDSREETLRVQACVDSIEAAEDYIAGTYPGREIYYFASSFGAYITGLYLSTRPHRGRKAFFRSTAVNMPSLFWGDDHVLLDSAMLRELRDKGTVMSDPEFGKPVEVTEAFLEDLARNDMFTFFHPENFGNHRIAMAHGACDEVIAPALARSFSEKYAIPLRFFPNEGHSLCSDPATPDRVVDLAIRLFDT